MRRRTSAGLRRASSSSESAVCVKDDLRIAGGLLLLSLLAWGISPAVRAWRRAHPPPPHVLHVSSPGAPLAWSPATLPVEPDPVTRAPDSAPRPSESLGGWPGLLLGTPLDLNTATLQDLEALPGVGPKTSAAIARTRQQVGGFRSVDDLLLVKGIGPKTLDRLRPWVTTGDRR
jgi:competence ComEA-like helix-hairpin-helix protein